MVRKLYATIISSLLAWLFCFTIQAQESTLNLTTCLNVAKEKNILIKQSLVSLTASQYNLAAEKQSYFPKVDLLAGYNYLSRPLEINLQTVRSGIVEGSAQQNVNAVSDIYKEITGNNLSAAAQDRIYKNSKTLINGIYPDYNPPLSKQSYFTAGVFVRQPLYLGNKLNAARSVASAAVSTNKEQVAAVQKETDFLIVLQYIRILYLNSMQQQENKLVDALKKNKGYADEMVKNQVLPPYQRNWANVAVVTAQAEQSTFVLEKQNALLELNKLLGIALDNQLTILDTLPYTDFQPSLITTDFWNYNPVYRLLQTSTDFAIASEKISRSFSLPNLFAVGNFQLYQNDLPVITPPWMVGVEMQWNIFNGMQTSKRIKSAKALVEASRLSEENNKQSLQVQLKVAANKIKAFKENVDALDAANAEAKHTTDLIEERMLNQLSSPKDVNESIIVAQGVSKAYFTALLGYYVAIAEYYNVLGTPHKITEIIR